MSLNETMNEESSAKASTTGLGAIFSYIQDNKETIREETKPDPNSKWSDIPLKNLIDVGSSIPKSFKSQRISSYFCDTCGIDLNSQVTFDAHVAGIKHQKKVRNLQKLGDLKTPGSVNKINVRKKKVNSTDLRKLLEETIEPALGLQYILEVFPESNDSGEYDAGYICELCCTEGACASIYAHILGQKHREKYLIMKYNLKGLDKIEIIREAKAIERKEGKRLGELKTIVDDERYPWPPGKRPERKGKKRSLEESDPADDCLSGESLTREYSRRGYNFDKHQEDVAKTSLCASNISKVLTDLQNCQVKNENDADMAHQVSAHLIKALADYKEITGDPMESRGVQVKCNRILDDLYSIRRISSYVSNRGMTDDWKGDVVDYGHGRGAQGYDASEMLGTGEDTNHHFSKRNSFTDQYSSSSERLLDSDNFRSRFSNEDDLFDRRVREDGRDSRRYSERDDPRTMIKPSESSYYSRSTFSDW